MRILIWHGYLLGGTGSNVYTRSIAREWSRAGHEVVRPDIGGLLRCSFSTATRVSR
jgi:hypothetical protein